LKKILQDAPRDINEIPFNENFSLEKLAIIKELYTPVLYTKPLEITAHGHFPSKEMCKLKSKKNKEENIIIDFYNIRNNQETIIHSLCWSDATKEEKTVWFNRIKSIKKSVPVVNTFSDMKKKIEWSVNREYFDIERNNENGETPLLKAAERWDLVMFDLLLEHRKYEFFRYVEDPKNIGHVAYRGNIFHYIALCKNKKKVKYMLNKLKEHMDTSNNNSPHYDLNNLISYPTRDWTTWIIALAKGHNFERLEEYFTINPEIRRRRRDPEEWLSVVATTWDIQVRDFFIAKYNTQKKGKRDMHKWAFKDIRKKQYTQMIWRQELSILWFAVASRNYDMYKKVKEYWWFEYTYQEELWLQPNPSDVYWWVILMLISKMMEGESWDIRKIHDDIVSEYWNKPFFDLLNNYATNINSKVVKYIIDTYWITKTFIKKIQIYSPENRAKYNNAKWNTLFYFFLKPHAI